MALKDDLKAVRAELSTQEQMIEGFIKGERFFKKYKYYLIALAAALCAWGIYSYASTAITERTVQANNALYTALLAQEDEQNLTLLKQQNPDLYVLYLLSQDDAAARLAAEEGLEINPVIKEILRANLGAEAEYLRDYNKLLQAFELLEQGKISEANVILEQIPENSILRDLVQNFKHYKGVK